MSSVAIIIINWNSWEQVASQLDVLQQDAAFEIHVVDNGSTDPCPFDRKRYARVTFELLPKNFGFAFACNRGFINTHAPWILFLNPDVTISAAAIGTWVKLASDAGYVASSPISADDRYTKPVPSFWSLLVEFSWLRRIFGLLSSDQTLIGGALLISRDVFFKLGGFDERFFLWFEDSDLTKRLQSLGARFGRTQINWEHGGGSSFRSLSQERQRHLFFHAMDVYMRKHFRLIARMVVRLITRRYHDTNLLPILQDGVSLVVPNLDASILKDFFENNSGLETNLSELVIVTSTLDARALWNYRQRYPRVRWIAIEMNQGFAHTVNIGLRVCRSRLLGTQNDDVSSDGTWINRCGTCFSSGVGSVNPVILTSTNEIESAGIAVLPYGRAQPLLERSNLQAIDATNAAAVLYSHAALDQVGIFDERFGSYLEDIDLSLRLARSGFENKVAFDASVMHRGQSTSSKMGWRKNWLDLKNWILLLAKNSSWEDLISHFPSICLERARNFSGLLKAILS